MLDRPWLLWMVCILGGYCSGGVMFCRILPKALCHRDICTLSDDGNPGAANVFVHCGAAVGSMCLALELLKGFWPVWLAMGWLDAGSWLFSLVMAAPVLGHARSPLDHQPGGKSIAVSFGVFLGLLPGCGLVWLLAGLYILFSTAIRICPNCLRSMVTYALVAALSVPALWRGGCASFALGSAAVCGIVVWRHYISRQDVPKRPCQEA